MAREPHFVVKYSSYLGTAIKLVLYTLITSVPGRLSTKVLHVRKAV